MKLSVEENFNEHTFMNKERDRDKSLSNDGDYRQHTLVS